MTPLLELLPLAAALAAACAIDRAGAGERLRHLTRTRRRR